MLHFAMTSNNKKLQVTTDRTAPESLFVSRATQATDEQISSWFLSAIYKTSVFDTTQHTNEPHPDPAVRLEVR